MESPTLFGRYRLLERIAKGGMAEVYRAQTMSVSGFEKELVIKRILPEHSLDPTFLSMFVDEARIAAKLHHPNIVQVFDFDLADGFYYIAMELVEGQDLSTIIETTDRKKAKLSLAECLFIMREVAKALDYAHRRQHQGDLLSIVHRDVSPHNILVSYDAVVKLTDFGIAKAASRLSETREGIVKGKLAYMSPEQARGEALDGRSDLFSLGAIFYELVTYKRLFTGSSERDLLLKVMNPNISSPRAHNRALPNEIETIIMRLLQRKREQRPKNAAELLGELERLFHKLTDGSTEATLRQRLAALFPRSRRSAPPASPGSWPPPVSASPATPSPSGRCTPVTIANPGHRHHDPGTPPVAKQAYPVSSAFNPLFFGAAPEPPPFTPQDLAVYFESSPPAERDTVPNFELSEPISEQEIETLPAFGLYEPPSEYDIQTSPNLATIAPPSENDIETSPNLDIFEALSEKRTVVAPDQQASNQVLFKRQTALYDQRLGDPDPNWLQRIWPRLMAPKLLGKPLLFWIILSLAIALISVFWLLSTTT